MSLQRRFSAITKPEIVLAQGSRLWRRMCRIGSVPVVGCQRLHEFEMRRTWKQ